MPDKEEFQYGKCGNQYGDCSERITSDILNYGWGTHNAIYIYDLLLHRTPETHWISVTNVIIKKYIKKINKLCDKFFFCDDHCEGLRS